MFGITFKSKTLAFSFKGDLCRGKDIASWLCLGEISEKERENGINDFPQRLIFV